MLVKMETGGSGGGGAPELLWANPNQYSGINGSLTIDSTASGWQSGKNINDYDGFIIAALDYADSDATRKVALTYFEKDISGLTDISARYNPILVYSDNTSSYIYIETYRFLLMLWLLERVHWA